MSHDLVGRKVKLKSSQTKWRDMEITTYELDDPEFVAEVENRFSEVRIFAPGHMGTADYQPFRVNVYINEDGVVREVSNG